MIRSRSEGDPVFSRRPRLRRPGVLEIEALLSAPEQPFSYGEVGATRKLDGSPPRSPAAGYDLDRRVFPLGSGRALFERACDALLAWRHFEIPWLELHGASAPAARGQVVATLTSIAGLWFLSPCRVVYTDSAAGPRDAVAFAYGTLPGHAVSGEERFRVSFDAATEEVAYEIVAFSRPALLLAKLGRPFARRVQGRFAESSAQALARAAS